jgi:dTDP-4-dehydrorhamnose 3,5-epimerase
MKVFECPIAGLLLIENSVFKDHRGFFIERYNAEKFKSHGLDINFIQDNHSRSLPNVVRGLHFQYKPAQSKLVGVIKGKIWDVAVDIRSDSPTYGQYYAVELSAENGRLLWVPAGFAHGFCVIGDEQADVVYKVNASYHPETERGIIWNDPELNIEWPVKDAIVAEKDAKLPSFASYRSSPVKW